jgi:hypothetical protein
MYYFAIGQSDIQRVCGWTFVGKLDIYGNRKWAVAPESAMARLGPSSRLIWGSVGSLKLESSSLRDAVVAVATSDLAVQLLAMIVISSSSTKGL